MQNSFTFQSKLNHYLVLCILVKTLSIHLGCPQLSQEKTSINRTRDRDCVSFRIENMAFWFCILWKVPVSSSNLCIFFSCLIQAEGSAFQISHLKYLGSHFSLLSLSHPSLIQSVSKLVTFYHLHQCPWYTAP